MCEQGRRWWHTGESRVHCGLLSWALMCRLLLCQWVQRPEVYVCCKQISLNNLKPQGLEWKALQHQWKLKLGKVSIAFFLFCFVKVENNRRKQLFSPAVLGPVYVKVVFMPPCCDCSRPGVFDCSVALERLYSAAPTPASPDGRPRVWSTRGDAAAVSHCVY